MKRAALASTFALLGGVATLLLLASIFYSCRQGGHPHDMGTDPPSDAEGPSHSRVEERPAPHASMKTSAPSTERVVLRT